MRKRMESSDIAIPTDITFGSNVPAEDYEYGQPMQYKKPGISTTSVPTKDVLEALKVSDLVGTPGLSRAAESVGYGQMPDVTDMLDTLQLGGMGLGAAKTGIKAAGALGDLAKSETGYKLAQKALQYAPAAQPMNIVKEPGGNWLGGDVEKQLKKLQMGSTVPKQEMDELKSSIDTAKRIIGSDTVDRAIRQMENELDTQARNNAMNAWMESNLTNYVKKQMGTKDDPVRKLAEQGVLHMEPFGNADAGRLTMRKRAGLGYPYQGVGESDKAKFWERLSDAAIDPYPAGSYKHGSLDESILLNNPWLQKVPDETMINSAKGLTRDLGFDHITDVLREDLAAGRIRPEQLNKVSMEQAVRRAYEYDQELAAKMKAAHAAAREGLPVQKEYPEGFRWMELNKPGAFASESETMGHSVRGYEPPKGHPDWVEGSGDSGSSGYGHGGWEAIKSGRAKVYSLVDKEGQPHVTVEVKNVGMTPEQRTYKVGILTQRLIDEGNLPEQAAAQAEKIYPEGETKQFITQIKGKQNRAPKEDYLPYVQDFVKSGNWSDVGDLQNTGLHKYGDEYLTLEQAGVKFKPRITEALNFLNTHPALDEHRAASELYKNFEGDYNSPEYRALENKAGQNISPNVPYTYKELKALLQSPEDWTDRNDTIYTPISTALENINKAKKELGIAPPEPSMAQGGAVSDAKKRLLDMIAQEPHMAGGGLLKAVGKAQKAAKVAEEAEKVAKYLPGVHYADPLAPPTMKMSEALGNAGAEGKTLKFTEADRSRVFGPNRGGVGFSGLQHYSEPHKQANTVWGFGNKEVTKKKINQNDPENTIWTTYVGSPNQHKSNAVVLQDAFQAFQDAVKSGEVHPAQINLMNDRIKAAVDDKTKARLFDPAYDLTDPNALDAANSFARRAAIGDVLLGEGVKGPMRRKEFKAQYGSPAWHDVGNMETLLKRETDPDLVGAGTFDVGNRLFVLDNGIIHRPDLNEAFPYQVTGNDLGMKFELVPKEIAMPDWLKQYELPRGKKQKVATAGYMDLARNNPSQFVSEEYLTSLQKQGKKKGGLAHIKKVKRHGNTVPN
jgi:hypothetical protein